MKIVTTPDKLIHFVFTTVVKDRFWLLKNNHEVHSPWFLAQMNHYSQWDSLFYNDDQPYDPCFYWQAPPRLLLPERAETLEAFFVDGGWR